MTMKIGGNHAAAVSNRHLGQTGKNLGLTMAKLSAGRRVMSARDDAAALAVGSRLQAEAGAQRQAYLNAGQGASLLQVADGGMARVGDALARMKTLAVQAGSDHLTADDRRALDAEFKALASEVDRIAADTDFGGTGLLDGSTASVDVRVGSGTGASDEVSAPLADVSTAGLSISGLDVASRSGADAANAAIDDAIDALQQYRAENGASQNRLDHAAANIATTIENTEAARSRLVDLDVAAAASDRALLQTRLQGGVYASRQSNAAARSILDLFT